jgi:hypothetical protein
MTAPQPKLAISNPAAYRENLFRLVGDRNPLDVLAETPSALTRIVREHSAAVLRMRPCEGKWTPNEIIGHLGDGEWVYGYRLRLILCEDDPALVGTKQDQWVSRQRQNEREPSELAEIFAALRRLNLALWTRLSLPDLARVGLHNERGPESLDVMLRLTAGHDLSHLAQIHHYLQATLQRS